MPILPVYTGEFPNDGLGDPLRVAFTTINANVLYLEALLTAAVFPNATIATLAVDALTVSGSVAFNTTAAITIGNDTINSTTPTTGALIVVGGLGVTQDTTIGGNLNIYGHLTVNGTLTTINTTDLEIADKNIILANGAVSAAAANGGGITLEGANATILYTSADDRWNLNKDLTVARVYGVATSVSSTLTRGQYLTGNNFTGAATTTWAVDATDANTGSKVVARDPSGNFSASTITASLSGTASVASAATVTNDVATDATKYITWVDSSTGNNAVKVSSSVLTFNPVTGLVTATSFAGTGTGTFATGTGNISLNGNVVSSITQTGATAFSTGTGAVSLNGNVTVAANNTFTQNGTGSFTTGSGAVSLNGDTTIGSGKTLTLSADPTLPFHSATKQYVDNAVVGLDILASAKVATTADIAALADLPTIDGVTVIAGNRVLVKNQATASQNGIYVAQVGTWLRATDSDTWTEIHNAYVWVELGDTQADTGWISTVAGGGTIDVTAITYTQFSAATSILAGNGLIKTGNLLDVVGTADRISVATNSIDIAATYAGQSSIVTVGALTAGSIGTGFTAIPNVALSNSTITIGTTSTALGAASLSLGGLQGLTFAAGAYAYDQSLSSGVFKTGTGAVSLNGDVTVAANKTVTLAVDPTLDMHAVTKRYVDTVALGMDAKSSVVAATTVGLPTYTYNNGTNGVGATITASAPGALVIDNISVVLNSRVLIKNEVDVKIAYNGIYTVTTLGDGGTAFVLTRATDFNSWVEMPGAFCWVESGTTNGTTSWACTATAGGVVGTNAISFSQFGGTNTLNGSASITLGGNVAALTTVSNPGTGTTLQSITVDTQGRLSSWAPITIGEGLSFANGTLSLGTASLTVTTTDATPTAIPGQPVLPNYSASNFRVQVVAMQKASEGSIAAGYLFTGVLRRGVDAASTTILGVAKVELFETDFALDCNVISDTVNGGISVMVTGKAATNIKWTSIVSTVDVTYA